MRWQNATGHVEGNGGLAFYPKQHRLYMKIRIDILLWNGASKQNLYALINLDNSLNLEIRQHIPFKGNKFCKMN